MTNDYVGDRPARTNEINLKGYEPALAMRPVACLPYQAPPIAGIESVGRTLSGRQQAFQSADNIRPQGVTGTIPDL